MTITALCAFAAGVLLASGCATYSGGVPKSEVLLHPHQPLTAPSNDKTGSMGVTPSNAPQLEDERHQLAQLFSNKPEYVALVFRSDADTTPPTIRTSLAPKYPFGFMFSDRKAVVKVAVVISEKGSVEDARVYVTSDERFSHGALDVIPDWTFHPATRSGASVKSLLVVPILFDGRQK